MDGDEAFVPHPPSGGKPRRHRRRHKKNGEQEAAATHIVDENRIDRLLSLSRPKRPPPPSSSLPATHPSHPARHLAARGQLPGPRPPSARHVETLSRPLTAPKESQMEHLGVGGKRNQADTHVQPKQPGTPRSTAGTPRNNNSSSNNNSRSKTGAVDQGVYIGGAGGPISPPRVTSTLAIPPVLDAPAVPMAIAERALERERLAMDMLDLLDEEMAERGLPKSEMAPPSPTRAPHYIRTEMVRHIERARSASPVRDANNNNNSVNDSYQMGSTARSIIPESALGDSITSTASSITAPARRTRSRSSGRHTTGNRRRRKHSPSNNNSKGGAQMNNGQMATGSREEGEEGSEYSFPGAVDARQPPPLDPSLPSVTPFVHNRFESTLASPFSNTPYCTGPVDRIGSFLTPPSVGVTQGELARRKAEAEASGHGTVGGGVLRIESFARYVVSMHPLMQMPRVRHVASPHYTGYVYPLTSQERFSVDRLEAYISHGVADSAIAPLREEWIDNIMALVPTVGPGGEEAPFEERMLDAMVCEVERDYARAVRTAIMRYVLLLATERVRLGVTALPPRESPYVFRDDTPTAPVQYHGSLREARLFLGRSLHVTDPLMLRLLSLWREYESLLLCAVPARTMDVPTTLEGFKEAQLRHRNRVLETMDGWYSRVLAIFVAELDHFKRAKRHAREGNDADADADADDADASNANANANANAIAGGEESPDSNANNNNKTDGSGQQDPSAVGKRPKKLTASNRESFLGSRSAVQIRRRVGASDVVRDEEEFAVDVENPTPESVLFEFRPPGLFRSAAAVLTAQLRGVVERSMEAYGDAVAMKSWDLGVADGSNTIAVPGQAQRDGVSVNVNGPGTKITRNNSSARMLGKGNNVNSGSGGGKKGGSRAVVTLSSKSSSSTLASGNEDVSGEDEDDEGPAFALAAFRGDGNAGRRERGPTAFEHYRSLADGMTRASDRVRQLRRNDRRRRIAEARIAERENAAKSRLQTSTGGSSNPNTPRTQSRSSKRSGGASRGGGGGDGSSGTPGSPGSPGMMTADGPNGAAGNTGNVNAAEEALIREMATVPDELVNLPDEECDNDPPFPTTQLTDLETNELPIFTVTLQIKPGWTQAQFRPSFVELESGALEAFDDIAMSLNRFADPLRELNVGSKAAAQSEQSRLIVLRDDDAHVMRHRSEIARVIRANEVPARRLADAYNKYVYLMGTEGSTALSVFLKVEHSLKEYRTEILRYRTLASEILKTTPDTVCVNAVSVRCDELKKTLSQRALEFADVILRHVAQDAKDVSTEINQGYEEIVNVVTAKPTTTEEVVALEDYFNNTVGSVRGLLNERTRTFTKMWNFLIEMGYLLSPEELFFSAVSYHWSTKVNRHLEEGGDVMVKEKQVREQELTRRLEGFASQLTRWSAEIDEYARGNFVDQAAEFGAKISAVREAIAQSVENVADINYEEELLKWPVTEFPQVQVLQERLEPYDTVCQVSTDFEANYKAWMHGRVVELDSERIEEMVGTMWRTIYKVQKELPEDEQPLYGPPVGAKARAAQLLKQLDDFKRHLPLLGVLCNPGYRSRHYTEISEIVGFKLDADSELSLESLLRQNLGHHVPKLEVVSDRATKEYGLERTLEKMQAEWAPVTLDLRPHRSGDTMILGSGVVDDVQQLLDDHIVKTQTMSNSPFIGPFAGAVEEWEHRLLGVRESVSTWLAIQAAWLYLEPIFTSEDIMKQMPLEGVKFRDVDAFWRDLMAATRDDPSVLSATGKEGLQARLRTALADLELIQSGIDQYLETKRLYFPRFFFLSNDELLEILAETKDPLRVQPHLKKCFEGIASLDFLPSREISAMVSPEGERVPFVTMVNPGEAGSGAVERWLLQVENVMRLSLRKTMARSFKAYSAVGSSRARWVTEWPGQIVLAVSQIYWTMQVEAAIEEGDLRGCLATCNEELEEIVAMVRGRLPKAVRETLGALVVLSVHARDVVAQMIKAGVTSATEFDWLSQLRYRFDPETEQVSVHMINSTINYMYEYLGNSGRLVITPLTDRCYRTLIGAWSLNLGGAPEGPAGTGKTETTKDLAKAIANQCVVFNCSDGLDYLAMGKFFKGLASSGAWSCFDEFNRIDLEVLSVIAQQILTIQQAIGAGKDNFLFEGTQISLNRSAWACITMNPGYAGRSELPDNCKARFRPVAMMVPDYALIAEISLYSYGFVDARSLAGKIVATYRLCSEMLSSQDHYDYGMRAVKSVLTAAGNLKRKQGTAPPGSSLARMGEEVLMLRAITDVNLPKFLAHDIPLFQGIVKDLFPGVSLPPPAYDDLIDAINAALVARGLQPVHALTDKIIQLYETICVRHGLMVVGFSFAGKTTALRALADALTDLASRGLMGEQRTQIDTLNPKAVTMGQLYGSFDAVTHEWTDGCLPVIYRALASGAGTSTSAPEAWYGKGSTGGPSTDTVKERRWMVFDGPVDAIWIENMNTVLDDNRKLCLMSGEVIRMSEAMNMIFEVQDLAVASPATVSRCGMVYMEPGQLGWRAIAASWVDALPHALVASTDEGGLGAGALLWSLLEWVVPASLRFVRSHECGHVVPSFDAGLVQSLTRILSSLLADPTVPVEAKKASVPKGGKGKDGDGSDDDDAAGGHHPPRKPGSKGRPGARGGGAAAAAAAAAAASAASATGNSSAAGGGASGQGQGNGAGADGGGDTMVVSGAAPTLESVWNRAATDGIDPAPLHAIIEALFAFAAVWSLGGTLDPSSRERFDAFLRKLLLGKTTEPYNVPAPGEPEPDLSFIKWDHPLVQPTNNNNSSSSGNNNDTKTGGDSKGQKTGAGKSGSSSGATAAASASGPGSSNISNSNSTSNQMPGSTTVSAAPLRKLSRALPSAGSVFDYVYDVASGTWKHWMADTRPADHAATWTAKTPFRAMMVPTVDTVRYAYLLRALAGGAGAFPVVLVGPTGTGKTAYISKFIGALPRETHVSVTVNFSAQTTANQAQDMIDARLVKADRGVFSAPGGRRCAVFVDDLNIPAKEKYGAQPPIELLRQYLDHGGWYDYAHVKQGFRAIRGVQLIAAMCPPGGGRNDITPRLLRHLTVLAVSPFSAPTMCGIYDTILEWFFRSQGFSSAVTDMADGLVRATLAVYEAAVAQLLPIPAKSHYVFNLRDFSRVVQGLLLAHPTRVAAKESMVMLWVHEAMRVFHDRLADDEDRVWVKDTIARTAESKLRCKLDTVLPALTTGDERAVSLHTRMDRLTWGEFVDDPEHNPDVKRLNEELAAKQQQQRDKEAKEQKLQQQLGTAPPPAAGATAAQMTSGRVVKRYTPLVSYTHLPALTTAHLREHNLQERTPLDVVLFPTAAAHLARVCRVLSLPMGHAVLVGAGGTGRRSTARLAATVCGCRVYTVEITRSYGRSEWLEDLKGLMRVAGGVDVETGAVAASKVVFLLSDTQLRDDSFLEDVSNLLNAGEVPNLFAGEEKSQVVEAVRAAALMDKAAGDGSPGALFSYFIDKCRENIHVVLCLSPIGDAFRNRLRAFPSLVNCCTIDWFDGWPADALRAVAMSHLERIARGEGASSSANAESSGSGSGTTGTPKRTTTAGGGGGHHGESILRATQEEAIVQLCQSFHADAIALGEKFLAATGRRVYVTPTSYLELIGTFRELLLQKREETETSRRRYETGLQKLASASSAVGEMQQELIALQPVLLKTREETAQMIEELSVETAEVDKVRAVVAAEEAVAQKAADESGAIKAECERELGKVTPILEAAVGALDTLDPADIAVVKSMKNPPIGIKVVMEAVCIMLEVKPVRESDGTGRFTENYWASSKKVLTDMSFLDTLKDYDKDSIKPSIVAKITRDYMPNKEFVPERVKNASSAAEGLCKWVRAMVQYDEVLKVVRPKQQALAVAEGEYETVMASLNAKRAQLQEVEDKIAELQRNLDDKEYEKADLERQAESCSTKISRAEKLIGGLGGEKERWTEAARRLGESLKDIPGDVLLCAAVIAYLGPFTVDYRRETLASWVELARSHHLPMSQEFSMAAVLGQPVRIREWQMAGLPTDAFSTDNAIMVRAARRWPLMIDPQGQANRWIKNMEKENKLVVLKPDDPNLLRSFENAVQFGVPVLLENIGETLDPSLEPLLVKELFRAGNVWCIRLGDTTIEYSEHFKLYMTTKLRNPHYLPEVSTKVTLLNFVITPLGLEDQLLGSLVAEERPELEAEKNELIVRGASNRRQLKELEDKILSVLSASRGNILEDESAIQALAESKEVSIAITEDQVVADAAEKKIDAVRDGYRPVASRASVLFFTIADLASIDPMYQYSLGWFSALFVRSIRDSKKSAELRARLSILNEYFTYALYRNVCRSLFERDKLLFSLHLCVRVLASQGQVDDAELAFLMTSGGSMGIGAKVDTAPNPCADWLPGPAWDALKLLSLLPSFRGIHADLIGDVGGAVDGWKAIYESRQPHLLPIPGRWQESLTPFQRLLALRAVRPDKMTLAAKAFVDTQLGERFTDPPAFDLGGAYDDSRCDTPIIFVLSPGVDPMNQLMSFAEQKQVPKEHVHSVSLGQGQGPIAERLLQRGLSQGHWVVLQNCHLAVSWLPAMDRLIDAIDPQTANPGFRLWLTSYPSSDFPVAVLQNGVKLTNEPPRGLRANIIRSLTTDPIGDDSFFELPTSEDGSLHPADAAWKPLLFSLAFFHAIVQERRSFGPLGWNIAYEFNETDLRISVRQLRLMLEGSGGGGDDGDGTAPEIPFKALRYLTGECNYGGRVTDERDRLTLNCILARSYTPRALEPGYALSSAEEYTIPPPGSRGSFLDWARSLPEVAHPEVFGLHANADITKDINDSNALFTSLLSMSDDVVTRAGKKAAGGGGGNANDSVDDRNDNADGNAKSTDAAGDGDAEEDDAAGAAVDEYADQPKVVGIAARLLEELPAEFDVESAQRKYPVLYEQSMNTVLCQELIRYNRLVREIRRSLENSIKAVKGQIVMSEELDRVSHALVNAQVPAAWIFYSYPTRKSLGPYIADLLDRLAFFSSWIENGPPVVFWISGFFFTHSFLTAALQNAARRYTLPIDTLVMDFEFRNTEAEVGGVPPEDGVYIKGIWLEGARWDPERMMLAECRPKELFAPGPVVWLKPCQRDKVSSFPHYMCPVYKTLERHGVLKTTGHSSNYLDSFKFPSDKPSSHWTLRGVAGVLSIEQ